MGYRASSSVPGSHSPPSESPYYAENYSEYYVENTTVKTVLKALDTNKHT